MKTISLTLIILCLAVLHSFAQEGNNRPRIGIGLDVGTVVGPAGNSFAAASSLLLKFQYPIRTLSMYITFTTGYTGYLNSTGAYFYLGGDSGSTGDIASFIPVEAGVRLFITRRLFIEGDLGASFNKTPEQDEAGDKRTAFIYAPIAGYSFPIRSSSIDVTFRYESRQGTKYNLNQFALGVAFNLGL